MNRHSTFSFAKHYAEMVAVMFAGMFVLGGALIGAAGALGVSYSELKWDMPGAYLAGMGLTMGGPMVWWMHRRGHSWAANGAMALAMFLPTVATLVLLATGAMTGLGSLMAIEHSLMFPGMAVAMLAYRSEYTHGQSSTIATTRAGAALAP
jgi:hypothetical protein